MVPVTMLPVVFALAIRTIQSGRRDAWLAAAVATLAVSTIHPLVAAMLALALSAFSAVYLLFHPLQGRAWRRSLALAGLVAIVMALPLVQLFLARGEAPLAASYPSSFEGWPIGRRLVSALPFLELETLDLYGPLPEIDQLEADQANDPDNPFLLWRFAVNMNRRRLILFDRAHYISDPSLILEPPYLLALLLLPLLLWRRRNHPGVLFAFSVTAAVLFVMFDPVATPLVGSLVMPWILWRMVWVLPYALIIALALDRFVGGLAAGLAWLRKRPPGPDVAYLPLVLVVAAGLLLAPAIQRNLQNLNDRAASPYFYPTPQRIFDRLNEITSQTGPATVLADQDLSVTIPAYVANANVVAHRAPTTSEIFPAGRQDEALQRLIDQDAFFRTPYLTAGSLAILERYSVRYLVVPSGSDLDLQLRLAPHWFGWLLDDQSYSLYAVERPPEVTATIEGNTALLQRQWDTAGQHYQAALQADPGDLLALVGLAEIAHARGQFDEALAHWRQAVAQVELPILHYRLGLLYAEQGQVAESMAEFDQAQQAAPQVARFHLALGDACLSAGQEACAAEQFAAAVAHDHLPDEAARLIAQADLWRQRGRADVALPLYEEAVRLRPSAYNHFVLASAYRELGRFDQAEALIRALRAEQPWSAEVMAVMAETMAAQGRYDEAVALYREAIRLQTILAQDSANTRLALAETLLQANRLAEAETHISRVLELQPYHAAGHRLQGDLYRRRQQFEEAIAAYQRAFELDPTQIAVYVSLSDQLRQYGGPAGQIPALLQAAIELNPGEATLLLALGDQLQRLGQPQAAIDAYQTALSTLDPYERSLQLRERSIGQSRAFIYARLAGVYEDQGQLEPAMHYYRAVVAAAPETPWTTVTLADALRRRNDLDGAEALYRQAIRRDPRYVDGYVRLADLLALRGQTAEARTLYAQALQLAVAQLDQPATATATLARPAPRPLEISLESDESLSTPLVAQPNAGPDDPLPLVRQADDNANSVLVLSRLYQLHGQTDQAIQLYQQQLELGTAEAWPPTILARYHKGLGDLYLAQEQLDPAVAAYEQAIALDNWWPEARLGLAEALAARGHSAQALEQLQTAVAVAPGSVVAQVALANALERQGEADQALAIYQATAGVHPGNAYATLTLARAWQNRRQWDLAEAAYQATLALNPGASDVYVGLAEVALFRGHYDEAAQLLQQAIQADSQNISIYIRLVDLEQRRGNPEAVLTWHEQATAISLAGPAADLALVDSLMRYGNYQTALAYLEVALERRPEDVELLLRLGAIQRTLGQSDAAKTTLQQVSQGAPADGRPYAALGELYLAEGQTQQALSFYQEALDRQPEEESYYLAISRIWAGQGRFDEAVATLEMGLRQAPRPVALYATLSALYLRQGQPEQALQTLEQGLQTVGENTPLLLALGNYSVSRADFDQARQQIERALALQPDSAAAYLALADLSYRLGDPAQAVTYARQAIALEPDNPAHHLNLGNLYRLSSQNDDAAAAYSQALALAPTLIEAYTTLGALYEAQERWDEARTIYERGLAIAPTAGPLLARYGALLATQGEEEAGLAVLDQVAPTAENLVARAAVYSRLGRPDEAQRDLETALAWEPGSVNALIALGDLLRAKGEVDKARQSYEQAVALMPGLPTGYLRLGELASEQGNLEEAALYVEAARQAEPGALIRTED